MTTHAKVPHLQFPFRIEPNGSAAVLEQDTHEEIAQSVQVLMMTREGERLEVPDYGLTDLLFNTQVDYGAITSEILQWEPRASVVVEEDTDALDEMIRTVRARVSRMRE